MLETDNRQMNFSSNLTCKRNTFSEVTTNLMLQFHHVWRFEFPGTPSQSKNAVWIFWSVVIHLNTFAVIDICVWFCAQYFGLP